MMQQDVAYTASLDTASSAVLWGPSTPCPRFGSVQFLPHFQFGLRVNEAAFLVCQLIVAPYVRIFYSNKSSK